MIDAPGTFDKQGWLTPGAVGAQPGLREEYETTGSLYACLTGFAHLGLPPNDYLWTTPATAWTNRLQRDSCEASWFRPRAVSR